MTKDQAELLKAAKAMAAALAPFEAAAAKMPMYHYDRAGDPMSDEPSRVGAYDDVNLWCCKQHVGDPMKVNDFRKAARALRKFRKLMKSV